MLADEACVFALFEKTHLLLMFAIEGMDVLVPLDKRRLRVHFRGDACSR